MGEEEIDLSSLDKDHHIHPFTDPKMLKQEGGPTVMVRGKGSTLWDADGKSYLDGLAGLWCVNVGYGRERLAEVARRQIVELSYYNTFFKTTTEPAARLSERLVQLTPDGSAGFNPAFDVTPARLVTALITDRGVAEASERGLQGLYGRG